MTRLAAIIVCMCLIPVFAMGNPFQLRSSLSLADMDQDGDLILRIRLIEVALDEEHPIDVVLDHRLEVLDYGRFEGRLYLRPFETCLWRKSEKETAWQYPGGGTVILNEGKTEGLVVTGSLHGPVEVIEGAWRLTYDRGVLTRFRLPSGTEIECKTRGNRICSLSTGGMELVSIDWGRFGQPASLKSPGCHYRFVLDTGGRLVAVVDEVIGSTIAKFTYDKNNLLISASYGKNKKLDIEWTANKGFGRGDSFYRKPYGISRLNDVNYEYKRDGNRVLMRKFTSRKVETLRWESLNGKIVFINDK